MKTVIFWIVGIAVMAICLPILWHDIKDYLIPYAYNQTRIGHGHAYIPFWFDDNH